MFSHFAAIGLSLIAQYPDALDVLDISGGRAQVLLLVDTSGSMAANVSGSESICSHFKQNHGYKCIDPGNGNDDYKEDDFTTSQQLTQLEVLQAALTGCDSATDGVLDNWKDRMDFGLMYFGYRDGTIGVDHCFSGELLNPSDPVDAATIQTRFTTLENKILDLDRSNCDASTPFFRGFHGAGRYMKTAFWDGTSSGASSFDDCPAPTERNAQNCWAYIVLLLSDGLPTADWGYNFDFACDGSTASCTAQDSAVPGLCGRPDYDSVGNLDDVAPVASYYANTDMICGVAGTQPIETYTVGYLVGQEATDTLTAMSDAGNGSHHVATDMDSLRNAFDNAISGMQSKISTFYSRPAVSRDGFFSGRYIYVSGFLPTTRGPWDGNIQKYCLFPPRNDAGVYDTAETSCLLRSTDGNALRTNPAAREIWNNATASLDVAAGGAAKKLKDRTTARKVYTFDPNDPGSGYVTFDTSNLNSSDFDVAPNEVSALINQTVRLNDDGTKKEHMLGAAIHSDNVLLAFHSNCEGGTNRCYVAYFSNDGLVHFIDAKDGTERSALVLPSFLRQEGAGHHVLEDLDDQPTGDIKRRYYMDGGARLFHRDEDTDFVIDTSEEAHLIFTLGRGGRALFSLDVSKLRQNNGDLVTADAPIYMVTRETPGMEGMQDVWGAPYLQHLKVKTVPTNLAVFSSGHMQGASVADAMMPGAIETGSAYSDIPTEVACAIANSNTRMCNNLFCDQADRSNAEIQAFCTTDSAHRTYVEPGGGVTWEFAASYTMADAYAYQVIFDRFDLKSGDYVQVTNDSAEVWGRWTSEGATHPSLADGPALGVVAGDDLRTPWIRGSSINIRFLSNGDTGTQGAGFRVRSIRYKLQTTGQEQSNGTVYLMDLDKVHSSAPFTAVAANPLVARFTKDCGSTPDKCHSGYGAQKMQCPITMQPAVLPVGGTLRAVYWGDHCGRMFKAHPAGNAWRVRRFFEAYDSNLSLASASYESRNFRKFMAPFEVASQSCGGTAGYAIYWGTGDIQNPSSTDEFNGRPSKWATEDPRGKDLYGVIFDHGIQDRYNLSDLQSITSWDAANSAPFEVQAATLGWYVDLADNESVFQRPIVFDGNAFYKTYAASSVAAAACGSVSGADNIYAVDHCNGSPAQNNDRRVWTGGGTAGTGMTLLAEKGRPPLLTHANFSTETEAQLLPEELRPRPFIFRWHRSRRVPE